MPVQDDRATYDLPEGKYHPTFLKALACAIHVDKLTPNELAYMFTTMTQYEIAVILYERVKNAQS